MIDRGQLALNRLKKINNIQGKRVDVSSIANGKVLAYNSTTGRIEYQAGVGGGDHSALTNLAYADAGHTGFAPSTNANYLNVYNVKNYGATGNGTTDDTADIVDAITAAGTNGIVYFPPGMYKISSSLTLPGGVTLQGAGWNTVITLANNSDCNVITQAAQNNDYSAVKDIQIDGNKVNQASGHGIYAYGSDRFLVENCFIFECKEDGIKIDAAEAYPCEQARIVNNYLLSNGSYGVETTYYATDCHIRGNDIGWSGLNNVQISSNANLITSNTIWGSVVGSGVVVYYCQDNTIVGNRIDYNSFHGIWLVAAKDVNISSNTLYLNAAGNSGLYDAINISSDGGNPSKYITLMANHMGTDVTTETQRYGINIFDSGCDYIEAHHNPTFFFVTSASNIAAGANVNGTLE